MSASDEFARAGERRSEGHRTARRRRCRVNAHRRRGRTTRREESRTRHSAACSMRRSRQERRPVEVALPTGATREWRCEVRLNREHGNRFSSKNE
eukprot:2310954-Pleurochrysis_carterae.AAC.1